MEGVTPIEFPETGPNSDVRDLHIYVEELITQANRPWLVKPDGIGKFIGSDEKVVLQLNGFHEFIVVRNAKLETWNLAGSLVNTIG